MNEKVTKIEYHPAFVSGIELLLWSYRAALHFDEEHYLSREPIRMDLLIVKKMEDVLINYDIGRIFLKHNVIEYKNPHDELSIDEFFKTIAYACLYKSLGDTVDEIPVTELTASIFRHTYSRNLFKTLKQYGAAIEKRYEGVYYVSGLNPFPVQVVVMKELDESIYSVLRVLTPNAREEDVRHFIEQASGNSDAGYRRNADAVFQISVSANHELYEKIRRKPEMCDALRDLMKDEIEAEVMAQRTKTAIETKIETYREFGMDDRAVVERIMSKYALTKEQAEEYVLAQIR